MPAPQRVIVEDLHQLGTGADFREPSRELDVHLFLLRTAQN